MNTDSPVLLINCICGVVFILAGAVMYKYRPLKINSLYGYRTGSSMKSQQHWEYAQLVSLRYSIICGIVMILAGVGASYIELSQNQSLALGIVMLIFFTVLLISLTENALIRKFGK